VAAEIVQRAEAGMSIRGILAYTACRILGLGGSTCHFGPIPPQVQEVANTLVALQNRPFEAMKPGTAARNVDTV
jgi:hypothetical protein